MRIAYVTETYPPEINGVALTVERTVQHLRRRGHAVQLIRPRQAHEPPCESADEWRTAGVPIPMYPELRLGLATMSGLLRRFLREGPELVHVATQGPLGRAALKAARHLGIPVTTDFRTNFQGYSRFYRLGWLEPLVWRYLRAFHRLADRTFVPTAEMRSLLRSEGIERVEVASRGVDAQRFAPQHRSAELRAAWGVSGDDQRVMLYVGRLAAEKEVQLALDAWEAARWQRPDTRMVVVGDGPMREALQERHPDAIFAGVQRGEDLARHYASADLFLFPSRSETFGNVTLEALASGLVTVAFDSAAAAEHLIDGVNGFLVPVDQTESFADAVDRALARPQLAAMRARARETAAVLRWDRVLGAWESRLVDAAAQGALRAPAQAAPA